MPHAQYSIAASNQPSLFSGGYLNKDKCDALDGLIINLREAIRVTIRENLCVFMKIKYIVDHELHFVRRWVRFTRKGNETA